MALANTMRLRTAFSPPLRGRPLCQKGARQLLSRLRSLLEGSSLRRWGGLSRPEHQSGEAGTSPRNTSGLIGLFLALLEQRRQPHPAAVRAGNVLLWLRVYVRVRPPTIGAFVLHDDNLLSHTLRVRRRAIAPPPTWNAISRAVRTRHAPTSSLPQHPNRDLVQYRPRPRRSSDLVAPSANSVPS